MSEHHILVIDDDERLRLLLRRFLEESGFRVTDVGSAKDARRILTGLAFDLLIIDVMMPGETGLEFLSDLRRDNPVPALFLTALSETEHRIQGLETGADDYMSKPFEPRELVLRIKSILGRASSLAALSSPSRISFGPYLFDVDAAMLTHDGERVHITTAEQKLLGCFASAPDTVLSRDDLSAAMDGSMHGRSIDVAVARLRGKIEPDARHPVYLQTVRNKGWLLRTDNNFGQPASGPDDADS
ncbi:MAG: response regulator transcription factor [Alphaproteobacteria bacterium]